MPLDRYPDTEGQVIVKPKPKVKKPQMYKVLLHNDDYTSMEFVVYVLVSVFHKASEEATIIMLDVHKKGIGVCGVYTKDIAATKVSQVDRLAKEASYPLKCSYEEA